MSASDARRSSSDRRRFLKLVGLAGVSSAVSATMAAWAAAKPPESRARSRPPTAAPADSAPPARGAPPEISEDARAIAAILERRHGEHLKPAQIEAVTREIDSRLKGGKSLREVKLANHDEPDFVFRA